MIGRDGQTIFELFFSTRFRRLPFRYSPTIDESIGDFSTTISHPSAKSRAFIDLAVLQT